MKKIIDLLTEVNFLVRLPEKKIKRVSTIHDYYADFTFKDDQILVTRVVKNGDNSVYVYYWTPGLTHTSYAAVPNDFKVEIVEGKDADKLKEQYRAFTIKNLATNLGHAMHIGSDPEIFVENEKGLIIPAFEFLGSKKKPNATIDDNGHGNKPLYWDGFQAEFETFPATCLSWQVDSVQCGLKALLQKAEAYNKHAKLSTKTVMDIPPEMLETVKSEYVEFGCTPSLNVYGLKGLQLPAREIPFRPAGGHIHFGIGKQTDSKQIAQIVKALDAILGVACVSLFQSFDHPKRRQLYGLPGEHRLPPHGIEYRVLSNAWLFHPFIMNLVFDFSRKVLVFGQKGLLKHWEANEQETIETITACDVKHANKILDRNKDIMLKMFAAAWPGAHTTKNGELLFEVFKNGMESIVKDPSDLVKNWDLKGTWTTHCNGKDKDVGKVFAALASGKKIA